MTFGKYLEKCIKKRDISVANLAKSAGINRGKLYYVFSEKRGLAEDELFTLIEKMGLSTAESDRLVDLYFEEQYGKKEFSRIKFLEKAIQRDNFSGEDCGFDLNADAFYYSIESREQLISSIAYLFFHDKEIISNFSFMDKDIDNAVFECLLKSETKLTHIMELSTDELAEENFERIFASLKYMYNGSFHVYRYANVALMKYGGMFYYYFVGEKYVILYNDKNGIFIDNVETVNTIRKNAVEIAEKSTLLGKKPDNLSETMSMFTRSVKQSESPAITVTYYPCFANFLDYDLLYGVIKDEIPKKKMVADIAVNFYSGIFENQNITVITTSKGFEKFTNDGNLQEIPSAIVNVMSKPQRIKLLKSLIPRIENGELYIFDDDKISMTPGKEILMQFSKMFVNGYDIEKENFCAADNFTMWLDDKSFMNTLDNFKDYVIRSGKVYTKEYTIKFIESLIVRLEYTNKE